MTQENSQKGQPQQKADPPPVKEAPKPITVSPGGPQNRIIALSRPRNAQTPKPQAPTQPNKPPANVPITREAPKPGKK